MNDKFIFLLAIILAVSGLYTYDKYKIGQGEPSPIGQMIDYAGLAKYIDMFEKKETVKTEIEYFHFDSRESIKNLLALQDELKEKRNALIAKRKTILEKLQGLNGGMQKETEAYISLLEKERMRILESLPKMQQYGKQVAEAYYRGDTVTQNQYYAAFKDAIMKVFEDVTDDPEENIPYIVNKLKRMEELLSREQDAINRYCSDVRGADLTENEFVARCIKKRVVDLQEDIKAYSKIVKNPEDDFLKVKEMTDLLDYEIQLLKNNSEATEDRIAQGAEEVEEGMRYLVQELVEISDKDLHAFLRLYSSFQKEQEALLNNLASNHRRFISSQKMNQPRIKSLLESLNAYSRFDFSSVLDKYDRLAPQREALIQEFIANERELFLSTKNRRKGNRAFVNNLIRKHESLKKKMNEDGGSDAAGKLSAPGSNVSQVIQGSDNAGSELMEERRRQRRYQEQDKRLTDQKMDALRTKARHDGFYD